MRKKDDLAVAERSLDLEDEEVTANRDQKIMELLFDVRTEVLSSQKQIHAIQVAQEEQARKVDDACRKVDKLHEKLLEPDTGLFARVKTVEMTLSNQKESHDEVKDEVKSHTKQVDGLVSFKEIWSKFGWYVVTGAIGAAAKYIWDYVITKK